MKNKTSQQRIEELKMNQMDILELKNTSSVVGFKRRMVRTEKTISKESVN